MLEIEDIAKEKIKIKGVEYDVDTPSVGQIQALNKAMKQAELKQDVSTFDVIVDFLVELGLNRDSVAQLKLRQLTMITEFLSGSKKN